MSDGTAADTSVKAALLCRTGARAGSRFPLLQGVTRIGRAPENDVVLDGSDAGVVSLHHCEISRDGEGFHVHDKGSTNGTWVNCERITDATISPEGVLRLGQQGPEFTLVLHEGAAEPLGEAVGRPEQFEPAVPEPPRHPHGP